MSRALQPVERVRTHAADAAAAVVTERRQLARAGPSGLVGLIIGY
jgi:hypothetical protein